MEELNKIIAQNLVKLRTQAGLTQLQLAKMINYSDKAVSKWERGESIPDVAVLVALASIYHIKLDDIVTEQPDRPVKAKLNPTLKRALICLLSVGLVWFIVTGVYAIMSFVGVAEYGYLPFILALPCSAIVCVVFAALWGNRLLKTIACSSLVWTIAVTLDVFCGVFVPQIDSWLFYIVAAPFQVLVILWFIFRKVK